MKRLLSKIALVLFSLVFMASAYSASYKNISALGCEAVFLDQAFDLKWDSVRLQNKHTRLSRWVVCPISRTASSLPENGMVGYINYKYFENTNFATPNGQCVFREIDDSGDISYSKSITLVNPGAGTSFGAFFSIPAGSLADSSSYSYWTMSCKLSPQTGLMSFDLTTED